MDRIRRLYCFLRAVPMWVKMKFDPEYFRPHSFVNEEWIAPVYVNKKTNKARIAESYSHEIDEEYIPQALFIGKTCKICGYKTAEIKTLKEFTIMHNGQVRIIFREKRESDEY